MFVRFKNINLFSVENSEQKLWDFLYFRFSRFSYKSKQSQLIIWHIFTRFIRFILINESHFTFISLFKLEYWPMKDPTCIFYLLNGCCRVTKRIYMKWIWHMLSYTRQSLICHLLDNCFLLTRRCWGLCRSKVEECCFGDRCSCG